MIDNEGCKELLIRRMFLAIASSILVQFFLVCCIIFIVNMNLIQPLSWIHNTWNIIVCFRMFSYFIVFAIVIFVQGFICSKDYLNPPRYSKSRFIKFCGIFSVHSLLVSSLYILIGGILVWFHLSLEDGNYGSIIRQCKSGSAGYCFVEEHCYLILAGYWTGFYFITKMNFVDMQHYLEFPIIPLSKFSQIRKGILAILPNAMINALWPSLYFLCLYYILGTYCRNLFTSVISLSIEDEPLDQISRLLEPSLFFHSWLHAVLFILSMNSMHLLFQAYLTEWIPFDIEQSGIVIDSKKSGKISLMEALTMNKIPIVQHLGYLDLVTVAQKDKVRRNALFALSQPGGHPYNWNCIVEKCLFIIKDFTEKVNSASSTKKEQPKPQPQQQQSQSASSSPILGKRPFVYNMRNLASSPSAVISPQLKSNESSSVILKQNIVPGEQLLLHYLKLMRQSVTSYLLSKPLIYYIFGEQIDRKVRHILVNGLPVIWAAEAISSLAAISIKEDPYGIVQKDLPMIIETLLSAKESLDKLQKMNVLIRKPVSEDKLVRHRLTVLKSAVRRSIYRIVSTFMDYIDELGLAPSIIDQLQPYFIYRE